MAPNPFVPTFGADPYIIVGRDPILDAFAEPFREGRPGAPGLTALITGERGMGKTVMLNEYESAAQEQGWLTISESGSPGLLERLVRDHLPRLLAQHDPLGPTKLKTTGGGVQPVTLTVTWEDRHPAESTLRSQVAALTDILAKHLTGLVITVDEVQGADPTELRKLGEVVQFARRERRLLGFAAAGLSSFLDRFLAQPGTTFLRRAERHTLADVRLVDARHALEATITDAGRRIDADALDHAAAATRGYPFMIQLVGYEAWRRAPNRVEITLPDVRAAIGQARSALGERVHAPALAPLSPVERAYLSAMAADGDTPSRTSDIAKRLGVGADYQQQYRARLLRSGIIEPAGRGLVRYTIPALGDYLLRTSPTDAEEERLAELARAQARRRSDLD